MTKRRGCRVLDYALWLLSTPEVLWSTGLWSLVAALAYRPLVSRFALPRAPTALALLSFTLVAIVTLTPAVTAWGATLGPRGCLSVDSEQIVEAFTHFGRGLQEKLNIVLFIPLGFFLTMATKPCRGHILASALGLVALPMVIEAVQGAFLGRYCSPLDWTDNAAGGLLGVAGAFLWLRRPR